VEAHLAELREHAAVYINSDSNGRGFLDVGGSHTLERFVTEVARDVEDPQRGVSVLDRLRARLITRAASNDDRKEIRERSILRIDALGSGSDYTPFLQHAGIASLDVGYGGEAEYGAYHSVYDSYDHFIRFGDPKSDYGLAQAKTTGRMMLRLANADFLPFETSTLADTVARYAKEVEDLAQTMRVETEETNRQIRERTMEIAADPTKPFVAPAPEAPVPFLNFAPLHNAVSRLQKASRSARVDDRTAMNLERLLTRSEGLPNRWWYKHHVYAPGFYTGYGVKTLPGIREAIEQRKWSDANDQIVIAARLLESYAAALEKK
jgi:N-acetylated-alpha-linked acidic dipeptidase